MKTSKEIKKREDLYYKDLESYMKHDVIPKVYARQLSSYYNYNLLVYVDSLEQYIGSIENLFNVSIDFNDIRKDVEEILKNEYNLVIVSDEPLVMKSLKK